MLDILLFYSAITTLIASVVAQFFFLRALKKRHHAAWVELGSRGLFVGATPRTNFTFARYLWRRDYRALQDRGITRLAQAMWIFSIISAFCLVALWLIPYIAGDN